MPLQQHVSKNGITIHCKRETVYLGKMTSMRRLGLFIAACAVVYLTFVQSFPAFAAANITSVSAGCGGVTVNFTVTTSSAGTFNLVVHDNTNAVVGTGGGGTSGAGTFYFSRYIFISPTLIDATPITVSLSVNAPNSGSDSAGPTPCTGGITPPSPGSPATSSESQASPNVLNMNDERINPAKGDITAVIYLMAEGGIQVYAVDSNGSGLLVISVTDSELASYPDNPDSNTRIANSDDGKITLYKLTSGEYQVNAGPDAEGKVISVIFTGRGDVYMHEFNVYQ
jgi:hypothetical protein